MATHNMLRLTLVGRSYCSLCDKMRLQLNDYAKANNIEFVLVDIDLDDTPTLEEQFGIRVPILMLGEFPHGVEICHYHFDETQFRLHC